MHAIIRGEAHAVVYALMNRHEKEACKNLFDGVNIGLSTSS